jgi:hypothetical protein
VLSVDWNKYDEHCFATGAVDKTVRLWACLLKARLRPPGSERRSSAAPPPRTDGRTDGYGLPRLLGRTDGRLWAALRAE